jgi:hypothetical protein
MRFRFCRKLLKDYHTSYSSENKNAQKRETINQERTRRKEKGEKGKTKQNTDFLKKRESVQIFSHFTLSLAFLVKGW